MEVDTGLLRALVAVSRTGNLTRAAAELYLSQPALSERVQRLERVVGTPLFERHPGGMRLTDAGRAMLPLAERAVALVDDAVREARAVTQPRVLRVDVVDGDLLVPRLAVAALREHLPEVELDISSRGSVDQVRRLRSGEIDLALGTAGPALPGITEQPLLDEPLGVALAADDPRCAGPGLSPEDLREDVHYLPDPDFAPDWLALVEATFGSLPVRTVAVRAESTRIPFEHVAAGACVAVSLLSTDAPSDVRIVPLTGAPTHPWVLRTSDARTPRALVHRALRALSSLEPPRP